MLNDNDSSFVAQIAHQAACIACEAENERLRPSVIWRPRLSIDGKQWCALYGENLMEGVAGFGDSPDKAMRDFDVNWYKDIVAVEGAPDA